MQEALIENKDKAKKNLKLNYTILSTTSQTLPVSHSVALE